MDMARSSQKSSDKKPGRMSSIAIIIAIVAVIAVIAAIAYARLYSSSSSSFNAFKSAFNSAPKVGIYVTADNSTGLSSTVGCATTLIERIVETPQTHRSPSSIGFYVMNSTSCVYSSNGLGGTIKNYTYTSTENCLNFSRGVPSIFLNYSNANSTLITHDSLYISGDAAFMNQCGIAYELT